MRSAQDLQKYRIEIGTGTVIKSILFVLLLIGLYYVRNVVTALLFSIVIASAVDPAATWLEKHKLPRSLAVLFIYIATLAVFGAMFYLIIPTFISEIGSFANSFPEYLKNPKYFQSFLNILPFSDASFSSISTDVLLLIQSKLESYASGFFKTAAFIFGGAMSFFLSIVLSFYLAVQKNGLEKFLRIISPSDYEDYVVGLWQRAKRKIGRWIQGQILLGILVGILVFLGLTILRVEYALIFALFAAVFELIPIFGPILASIPPIIVAFLQNPPLAIAVVILYIIIQQFENHLIYPLVVRKIIGVPPVLSILSIIIGGQLAGFAGIVLAVPIAAIVMEFLSDVADKKIPVFR